MNILREQKGKEDKKEKSKTFLLLLETWIQKINNH